MRIYSSGGSSSNSKTLSDFDGYFVSDNNRM